MFFYNNSHSINVIANNFVSFLPAISPWWCTFCLKSLTESFHLSDFFWFIGGNEWLQKRSRKIFRSSPALLFQFSMPFSYNNDPSRYFRSIPPSGPHFEKPLPFMCWVDHFFVCFKFYSFFFERAFSHPLISLPFLVFPWYSCTIFHSLSILFRSRISKTQLERFFWTPRKVVQSRHLGQKRLRISVWWRISGLARCLSIALVAGSTCHPGSNFLNRICIASKISTDPY